MAKFLRALIVAVIVMTGSVMPAMACPAVAPTAVAPTAMTGMDHSGPAQVAPACDMACLACLVQPSVARVGAVGGWKTALHYPPPSARLAALSPAPDVPPPRIVSV